jgi:hypothetical protein
VQRRERYGELDDALARAGESANERLPLLEAEQFLHAVEQRMPA